jgi:hypothetical protein
MNIKERKKHDKRLYEKEEKRHEAVMKREDEKHEKIHLIEEKRAEDRGATVALHRLHEQHGFHIDIENPRRRHELEDKGLR